MNRTIALAVAGGVALVGVGGVGAWALADDGRGDRIERGTCAAVTYELSAEEDDGALEVSYELTSAAPDETWQIRLTQDGAVLVEGERRTDADAEIDLDAIARQSGESTFEAVATSADGRTCTATLTR